MGGIPSHDVSAYQTEGDGASDSDNRGSLRVLTGMLTRQTGTKKHRGKLLVVGLDGAGKTTLVNHLSRVSIGDDLSLFLANGGRDLPLWLYPDPTRTQQSASYRVDSNYLMLVDSPGRRMYRSKWYSIGSELSASGSSNNLNNLAPTPTTNFQAMVPILAVLFVIDATDPTRFPTVAAELVRFLKLKEQNKMFQKSQLFLVLNKTDYFLPPPPTETPEEPDSQEYQQLLNNNKQQQRAAIREARRELRKCVDYELEVDQRRHPFNYRNPKTPIAATSTASSGKSWPIATSFLFANSAPVADLASIPPRRRNSITTNPASTTPPLATSILTSIVDCCAQDRDSVRALRTWINEELKKTDNVSNN